MYFTYGRDVNHWGSEGRLWQTDFMIPTICIHTLAWSPPLECGWHLWLLLTHRIRWRGWHGCDSMCAITLPKIRALVSMECLTSLLTLRKEMAILGNPWWPGTVGGLWELRGASGQSKNRSPQSYNHRQLNSANKTQFVHRSFCSRASRWESHCSGQNGGPKDTATS